MTRELRRGTKRCRLAWGAVVLIATTAPWLIAILLAHEYLAGSIRLTNAVFAVALVATYVGLWVFAIAASSSPRPMVIRATATTLVVMVIVLLLEVPAMLKLVHWNMVMRSLSGEGADYMTTYVLDKDLGFRRIPNLHWSGRPASDIEQTYGLPRSLTKPITFTYDRWGYRNVTDMERADIVLLGDSYVEGWYVSDEETVASRLAARLGRPVANLGVAGYGTMQMLRVIKGDALARQPRIIAWFFFEGNDLYDDQEFENSLTAPPPGAEQTVPRREGLTGAHGWQKRSFMLTAFHWLRRWSHPLFPTRARYRALLPTKEGSSQAIYFADYGAVPWTDYEETRWGKAMANFREGIEVAHNAGVHVMLVYVPIKYRVYRDFIQVPNGSPMQRWTTWSTLPGKFLELCRSVPVPCLDMTGPLQQAVGNGINVYAPTDTHWNRDGHATVASEIERALSSLGWLSTPRDAKSVTPTKAGVQKN